MAKKTSTVASLLTHGEQYVNEGLKVMLIGPHGTGKTETVRTLGDTMGMKIKSYSCATLDPFTDLVGVPVPRTNEDGVEELKMIRPRDIDEAQILFFDELNRARKEVQDAVLEIINNGTINGDPLPNLKAVFAAINPPGDVYDVDDLDPALMDRFDLFIEFKPRPSVKYMSQHMDLAVAKALLAWYNEHNRSKRESYISPRRLVKLGRVFEITRNETSLIQAFPPGGDYDSKKLYKMLEEAADPNKKALRDSKAINNNPNPDFSYDYSGIAQKQDELVKYLESNVTDLATHRAVATVLEKNTSGAFLVGKMGDVMNALAPSVLEALISQYAQPKQSQMRTAFKAMMDLKNTKQGKKCYSWNKLHSALNAVTKQDAAKLPPLS